MRIFSISDLHLSFSSNKPMDVFGDNWEGHHEKISAAWRESVTDDDIVLIAGDVSWAMKLAQADEDLNWVADLPGRKVIIRGNHDYWWASISKIRNATHDSMYFIQNDALLFDSVAIGGSRLWDFPDVRWPSERPIEGAAPEKKREDDSEKIRTKEISRLRMSFEAMDKSADLRIAMVHYPPLSRNSNASQLTQIMDEYKIDVCVYGHIHAINGESCPASDCIIGNTRYVLTSCDWLNFAPKLICEL